jgi:1-deoxy-D-xylulose-5-phosphate reductoisomerase
MTGFDFQQFAKLTFEPVDPARFPALELGFRACELGGDSGAVLNASDEVAVEAFLAGRIGFCDIERVNRRVLERRPGLTGSIERLVEADQLARKLATEELDALSRPLPPNSPLAPDRAAAHK